MASGVIEMRTILGRADTPIMHFVHPTDCVWAVADQRCSESLCIAENYAIYFTWRNPFCD
jgi:hypothetical protein